MDDNELFLKISISYENNHEEIICNEEKDIKEIKKECQNKLGINNIDINNINLWFFDDDKEKNYIYDFDDLINNAKEYNNPNYLSIELNVEIYNKHDEENYIDNEQKEENNFNDNKYEVLDNYKNIIKDKDKIILELKKEIEILKFKYQKNKISANSYKNLINYLVKISNVNSIKELKKKLKKQNKENEENNIQIKEQNKDIDKLKNEKRVLLYKENFDFINNKCNKCSKQNNSNIFRCAFCKDYFLCSKCLKENEKKDKQYHEHLYFNEIIFPEKLMKLIELANKKDKKYYSIIDKFNNFLNKIFFDDKGNFSSEEYKANDTILKPLVKEMKSINESPLAYMEDYKITCLNLEMEKLKNQNKLSDKMLYLIPEKISYLKINLEELEKTII